MQPNRRANGSLAVLGESLNIKRVSLYVSHQVIPNHAETNFLLIRILNGVTVSGSVPPPAGN